MEQCVVACCMAIARQRRLVTTVVNLPAAPSRLCVLGERLTVVLMEKGDDGWVLLGPSALT